MTVDEKNDLRVQRTKMAIFDAFRDLVLSRRYDDIRVAEIIAGAEVGRSTFYEHFNSKDDVLLTSIEPLFSMLADIAAGKADKDKVQFVLSHFWEQRAFARIIFHGALYEKLTRKLAEMIEARVSLAPPATGRLRAVGQASSMLGIIRAWLAGEFSMPVVDLTQELLGGNESPLKN